MEKLSPNDTNELLSQLGNSLLGLIASEHLSTLYPHLPTRALKAAVTSYVGQPSLASLARELGVGVSAFGSSSGAAIPSLENAVSGQEVGNNGRGKIARGGAGHKVEGGVEIRWIRQEAPVGGVLEGQDVKGGRGKRDKRQTWEGVVADVVRSFVGLVYQEQVRFDIRRMFRLSAKLCDYLWAIFRTP